MISRKVQKHFNRFVQAYINIINADNNNITLYPFSPPHRGCQSKLQLEIRRLGHFTFTTNPNMKIFQEYRFYKNYPYSHPLQGMTFQNQSCNAHLNYYPLTACTLNYSGTNNYVITCFLLDDFVYRNVHFPSISLALVEQSFLRHLHFLEAFFFPYRV